MEREVNFTFDDIEFTAGMEDGETLADYVGKSFTIFMSSEGRMALCVNSAAIAEEDGERWFYTGICDILDEDVADFLSQPLYDFTDFEVGEGDGKAEEGDGKAEEDSEDE